MMKNIVNLRNKYLVNMVYPKLSDLIMETTLLWSAVQTVCFVLWIYIPNKFTKLSIESQVKIVKRTLNKAQEAVTDPYIALLCLHSSPIGDVYTPNYYEQLRIIYLGNMRNVLQMKIQSINLQIYNRPRSSIKTDMSSH